VTSPSSHKPWLIQQLWVIPLAVVIVVAVITASHFNQPPSADNGQVAVPLAQSTPKPLPYGKLKKGRDVCLRGTDRHHELYGLNGTLSKVDRKHGYIVITRDDSAPNGQPLTEKFTLTYLGLSRQQQTPPPLHDPVLLSGTCGTK